MNPHIETVQAIYQAFGKGDVPAILARLSPEVEWDVWDSHGAQRAGYDLLIPRRGREAVGEFFRVLGGQQFHEFRVLDMLAGERQVAAELAVDFTYTATGRRIRDEEIHLWRFGADGLVTRYRHYIDTAKHLSAAGLALAQA